MPDADIDFTVNQILGAAFGSAGERCMALPVVVCVGDSVADKMATLLLEKIPKLTIDAYNNDQADLGPLYSPKHKASVEEYIL
ncbi:MAG: aldehyde dehydrogenase family protein [Ostreibacterium sp.]